MMSLCPFLERRAHCNRRPAAPFLVDMVGADGNGVSLRCGPLTRPISVCDQQADSLIDAARRPLNLSRETDAECAQAKTAHHPAEAPQEDRGYTTDRDDRQVELAKRGKATQEAMGQKRGLCWTNRIRREQAVTPALAISQLLPERRPANRVRGQSGDRRRTHWPCDGRTRLKRRDAPALRDQGSRRAHPAQGRAGPHDQPAVLSPLLPSCGHDLSRRRGTAELNTVYRPNVARIPTPQHAQSVAQHAASL